MKKLITICILSICFIACFKNYYRVNTDPQWSVDKFKSLGPGYKTYIIHFSDGIREMADPVIEDNTIKGVLNKSSIKNPRYLSPDTTKNNVYKYRDRDMLFSQLHIYVNDSVPDHSLYTIQPEKFNRLEVYKANKGASVGSHILGGVLVLVGTFAVAGLIALISCACPQVHVESTPGQYEFVAGMYSGAIMKNLERTDMLPLTGFNPSSDSIRIRITGLPGETQYLNYASLKPVVHPPGTEVVGSRQGNLFLISHLELPKKVMAGNVTDRSKSVSFRDDQGYGFHIADSSANSSELIIQYNRPSNARKAVLVARVKNTYWGGYVYKSFKGLYGKQYASWINEQETNPQNNPLDWQLQQGLVMKVSVLTRNGWTYRDYFPAAGNTASRDLAMELDLSDVEGELVQVKLESAYRFWEVDRAALSYHTAETSAGTIYPGSASLNTIENAAGLIATKDDQYAMLSPNDHITLSFPKTSASTIPGSNITYVLVLSGYYHQTAQNNQAPQVNQLMKFRTPGQFHRYSMEKYNELGLLP